MCVQCGADTERTQAPRDDGFRRPSGCGPSAGRAMPPTGRAERGPRPGPARAGAGDALRVGIVGARVQGRAADEGPRGPSRTASEGLSLAPPRGGVSVPRKATRPRIAPRRRRKSALCTHTHTLTHTHTHTHSHTALCGLPAAKSTQGRTEAARFALSASASASAHRAQCTLHRVKAERHGLSRQRQAAGRCAGGPDARAGTPHVYSHTRTHARAVLAVGGPASTARPLPYGWPAVEARRRGPARLHRPTASELLRAQPAAAPNSA